MSQMPHDEWRIRRSAILRWVRCATQHGGTGRYVFLGPDGGHYRRSNYARRVFRPACDGRFEPAPSRPARLVIADTTVWPGIPVAMWPTAPPPTTSSGPAT